MMSVYRSCHRLMYHASRVEARCRVLGGVRLHRGGKGMSEQDKTRVGSNAHPSPAHVAANGSMTGGVSNLPDGLVVRQPQESTVMVPSGLGPPPPPPGRRTIVAASK